LAPQTFAQTNKSVGILITDAIEDLQNGDTNAALTHSNLALQELSSSVNEMSIDTPHVTIDTCSIGMGSYSSSSYLDRDNVS
jgi:hypothetical protein